MSATPSSEPFGAVIHAYTRAAAIADGVLKDITEAAGEAGFTVAVAITDEAWDACVRWLPDWSAQKQPQDERGRLWDVLQCLRTAVRGGPTLKRRIDSAGGELIEFIVNVVPAPPATPNRQIATVLKALSHAGDGGEHVLTVMLRDES